MTDYMPIQVSQQRTLFPVRLGELLQSIGSSAHDQQRWQNGGLLSFGPNRASYEPYEVAEAQFVATIMHSGMTRQTINDILDGLAKPYRYDPELVCYSFFLRTWRQLPSKSEEELRERYFEEFWDGLPEHIEAYLGQLVEAGDDAGVDDVYDRVRHAMGRLASEKRKGEHDGSG